MTLLLVLVVLGGIGFAAFVAVGLTETSSTTRPGQEPQAPGGYTRPAPGPRSRRWT